MERILKLAAAAVMLALFVAGAADAAEVAGKGHGSLGDKSTLLSYTAGYSATIGVVVSVDDVNDWTRSKGASWGGKGKGKSSTAGFGTLTADFDLDFEFDEKLLPGVGGGKHHGKGRRMLQQATPSDVTDSYVRKATPLCGGSPNAQGALMATSQPVPISSSTASKTPTLAELNSAMQDQAKTLASDINVSDFDSGDVDVKLVGGPSSALTASFSGTLGRFSQSASTDFAGFLPTSPDVTLTGKSCTLVISVRDEDGKEVCSLSFLGKASDISYGSALETYKTFVGTDGLRARFTCGDFVEPKAVKSSSSPASCPI